MQDTFWDELEKALYKGAIKKAKMEKDVDDIEKGKYALYFTRDELERLYRMLNQLHDKQHFWDKDTSEFFFELLHTIERKLGIDLK